MFKFLKDRKKKDNKGFTLGELVIVVAILAILVGILAPQYTKYVEKSRKAADASNLENLVTAFKTAASDGDDQIPTGEYTITINLTAAGNKTSTTLSVPTTLPTGVTQDTIEGIIESYAGKNWKNTKLKSKKWTDNGKTDGTGTLLTSISAKLTVGIDGSVTVEYTPESIKDQTNQ